MAQEAKQNDKGDIGSKYSIIVENATNEDKKIALFQTNPDKKLIPLVWISRGVEGKGGKGLFSWEVQWGLSWGQSDSDLASGVSFTGLGQPLKRNPYDNKENAATIAFNKDKGNWDIEPIAAELAPGYLGVNTDKSFSTDKAQNEKFCVSVQMDGKDVLAMEGGPNLNYKFRTHPTYYVAITDEKESVAVSGMAISNSTAISFDGVTKVTCKLNNDNAIEIVSKE